MTWWRPLSDIHWRYIKSHTLSHCYMRTSWHRNIFCITVPLWRESTGHYCSSLWRVCKVELWWCFSLAQSMRQGKSEGFESCDRPIVRKRPIWVKIGDVLSRVTLKFDGWPWKTIGHLSFAVSSFVQHFIAICEFKLELPFGNAQFGSKSMIFLAVWPCNLTNDLEKQ